MCCRCVWAGDECGDVLCCRFVWAGDESGGVRVWCRCVWAGDECEGVCGVGVYGLGMSAEVSVVSFCMGWG